MLVNCPECQTEVSDKAATCVKCGNPIKPTVIEATGKRFKSHQLLGAILVVFGMLTAIANPETAIPYAVMGVGAIWFLIARAGTWWGHG